MPSLYILRDGIEFGTFQLGQDIVRHPQFNTLVRSKSKSINRSSLLTMEFLQRHAGGGGTDQDEALVNLTIEIVRTSQFL